MRVGWPVSLVNVYIISEDDMGSLSHVTLLTNCDLGPVEEIKKASNNVLIFFRLQCMKTSLIPIF